MEHPESIAAARYALIAPIVSRQTPLAPGEMKALLQEASRCVYEVPGGRSRTVSIRTLERWVEAYRKGGWDALKPRVRSSKGRLRMDGAVLEKAKQLRRERPERSVEQIIFLLEEGALVPPGTVAPSTLARHLRQAGLSRRSVMKENAASGHRRFEAEDILVLVQADFKHFVYLPDPRNPKKRRKTILCLVLDDYSRYILHAQFYFDEKLPRLEDCLKKAILRCGVPEMLYVDNGAAFSSQHLTRICGKLGIDLRHTRPFQPRGRGKIERSFQFIDTSFLPEVYARIEAGQLTTLEELNDALWAWIDGYYHQRVHGGTKETPQARWNGSSRRPRRVSLAELNEIFLWEETRKVDATGCVRLWGNTYEVDGDLGSRQVTLRYDPYDLREIQVWFEGVRRGNAKPVELRRYRDRRVPADEVAPAEEADVQLSFLDLAEQKRKAQWKEEEIRYACTTMGGEKR
ncbi:LOW QUALITY PROTEIN: Mu transposase/integrase [Thermobacillus composti KWC4]|uniref:Mu transposase/integrase n=1 Tax=Thermobacillus composti (strain DSM 18247 / JCM 13945 / KWC4) TaxID=717605 RepID=L0EFX3_THECK|nr:LOW QUALITY PROTEIN: Mu transposase/integrase [Thermobacillus composti KWC4]